MTWWLLNFLPGFCCPLIFSHSDENLFSSIQGLHLFYRFWDALCPTEIRVPNASGQCKDRAKGSQCNVDCNPSSHSGSDIFTCRNGNWVGNIDCSKIFLFHGFVEKFTTFSKWYFLSSQLPCTNFRPVRTKSMYIIYQRLKMA